MHFLPFFCSHRLIIGSEQTNPYPFFGRLQSGAKYTVIIGLNSLKFNLIVKFSLVVGSILSVNKILHAYFSRE